MTNTRRKKGQGTIRQLPNGKFQALLKYRDIDNQSRMISRTFQSYTAAEKGLKAMISEVEKQKEFQTTPSSEYTVERYMKEIFLPYKKITLKPQSHQRLVSTVNNYIIKYHGNKQLNQIKSKDINALLSNMHQDGKSHSTVKKVHDAYSAMFTYAVKNNDISMTVNPMNGVEMIPERNFTNTKEVTALTKEEIAQFAKVAHMKFATDNWIYRYGPALMFLMTTGIREGEICALTKKDFDFDEYTVKINKSVTTYKKEFPDGTSKYVLEVGTPKTSNSVRVVPLSPEAIKYAQEVFRIFPDGEQFIYTDKGKYVTPNILYKQFNKILERAGLPKRGIHTLRHTFVSMLFDNNVDTLTIAEIIGDTESTVVKTYLHIFHERKARSVQRLNIITPIIDELA